MQPNAKVIKAVKFEDGTYTINAAPLPWQAGAIADPAAAHAPEAPFVPSEAQLAAEATARALVEAAQADAEAIRAAARAEAEAVATQAQADAELLRAQAAEAAQRSGFAQGLDEGREAGHTEVLGAYKDQLQALVDATDEATAERQAWFAAHEKDVVKMAVLIAQKILLTELAMSRQSVLKLAAAALKRINDKTQVRLRVHPDDLALVMKAKGPLMLSVDNLTSLEVLGDPAVGLGGCVVETRTGIVDARVATQLAEVATTLLEIPLGDAAEMDPVVARAIQALGEAGVAGASPEAPTFDDSRWDAGPTSASAPVSRRVPVAPAPVAPAAPAPEVALAAPPVAELVVASTPLDEIPPSLDWREPEVAVEPEPVAIAPEPVVEEAPAPESLPQAIARMTDEEVEALTSALSELLPPEAPEAEAVAPARSFDPSRVAADALALRLGKLKKGRAVARHTEEVDMKQLEGALSEAELEEIVRHVMHKGPGETDIAVDQPLVHVPGTMDAAAEALAERLGQKKKRARNWYEGVESLSQDGPSDKEQAELENALADDRIDQIMSRVVAPVAGPAEEAEPAKPADLAAATDNLAKLLGKKKRGFNKPWYDGID